MVCLMRYFVSFLFQFQPEQINVHTKLYYAFVSKEGVNPELYRQMFCKLTNSRHNGFRKIYTDASVSKRRSGAAAVLVDSKIFKSEILTKGCSVAAAEMYGIFLASQIILEVADQGNNKFVIYSDSQNSVTKFWRNEGADDEVCNKIKAQLLELVRKGFTIEVCWIPGHVEIEGNELADHLARCGSKHGYTKK